MPTADKPLDRAGAEFTFRKVDLFQCLVIKQVQKKALGMVSRVASHSTRDIGQMHKTDTDISSATQKASLGNQVPCSQPKATPDSPASRGIRPPSSAGKLWPSITFNLPEALDQEVQPQFGMRHSKTQAILPFPCRLKQPVFATPQ